MIVAPARSIFRKYSTSIITICVRNRVKLGHVFSGKDFSRSCSYIIEIYIQINSQSKTFQGTPLIVNVPVKDSVHLQPLFTYIHKMPGSQNSRYIVLIDLENCNF